MTPSAGGPLGGVIVPIITPVDEHDRVDEAGLRAVIRACLSAQVDAIFAGGSAGAGPLLTDRQWRTMMTIAADEVAAAVPLLGGVMETSTARALERIRVLEELGFRRLVLTPTFYLPPAREHEFLAHFGACRAATALELIAYNIPACTGSALPLTVVEEMSRRGWISACKESSADREYFAALLDRARPTGLRVFQGSEVNIAWGLERGAHGIVPVCANFAPGLFVAAWRAALARDAAELARCQALIDELVATVVRGEHYWIAGVMHACALRGMGSGLPVRPLRGMPDGDARAIAAVLARLGPV